MTNTLKRLHAAATGFALQDHELHDYLYTHTADFIVLIEAALAVINGGGSTEYFEELSEALKPFSDAKGGAWKLKDLIYARC